MVERKSFYTLRSYLLGAASELAAPALGAYARSAAPQPALPPSEWRRGLILGATRIGDVLYRTASLGPLAQGLPGCEWHYLAEPASAEVLRGNPNLATVHAVARPEPMLSLEPQDEQRLRGLQFDVALCTDAARYVTNLRLALRLGIPARAGFTFRGLSAWVTHPVPIRYPSPTADYVRQLVAHVTGRAPNWPLKPVVYLNQADREAAESLWEELELGNGPTIACFLTTREPSMVWPLAHLAEALEQVAAKRKVTFVLAGAKSDEPALVEMSRRLRAPYKIACGRLSLLPLVAFLQKCRAVYSPDSGPRHLANAAGTPVVFIRNLRVSKVETGAYLPTEIDVSPDEEIVRPSDQVQHFKRVEPARVASALLNAIDQRC